MEEKCNQDSIGKSMQLINAKIITGYPKQKLSHGHYRKMLFSMQELTYSWYVIIHFPSTVTTPTIPCISQQIPAMGWVAKDAAKTWSFSQAKYGAQKENECDNPDEVGCNKDAGNGVLLNGSFITGNDPTDANKITTPADAAAWVTQINDRYGDRATVYGIDNEPTIWYDYISTPLCKL